MKKVVTFAICTGGTARQMAATCLDCAPFCLRPDWAGLDETGQELHNQAARCHVGAPGLRSWTFAALQAHVGMLDGWWRAKERREGNHPHAP